MAEGGEGEGEVEVKVAQALSDEDFASRQQMFNDLTADLQTEALKEKVKAERKERTTEELNLDDIKALTYSEMDMATLHDILNKIKTDEKIGGTLYEGKGVFLDLGSGSGKACLQAALLHPFEKVVGIDFFQSLTDAASSVMPKYQEEVQLPEGVVKPELQFIKGDFVTEFEAHLEPILPNVKVCLAVATCFGDAEMQLLTKLANKLPHDSFLITFSRRLPDALLIDPNRHPKQRASVAVKKAHCVRGRDPASVNVVIDPPANDPKGWYEVYSEERQMSWGPSTCFVFRKTWAAIVMTFKYEYVGEGSQEKVDAVLKKSIQYYKDVGEFGPILTTFTFSHVEGGYTAIEAFPSAAAYEEHAKNTASCPFIDELMGIMPMIKETEAVIYATDNEYAAAPSIAQFYPNGTRKTQLPDLNKFGEPFFGWTN